jgi:hypothetical protein
VHHKEYDFDIRHGALPRKRRIFPELLLVEESIPLSQSIMRVTLIQEKRRFVRYRLEKRTSFVCVVHMTVIVNKFFCDFSSFSLQEWTIRKGFHHTWDW